MGWYIGVFKKYAVFSGRASRQEYWMFFLFNILVAFILSFLDGLFHLNGRSPYGPLYTIYELAVLVPTIAVFVRRMHDSDRSGWWSVVPIVCLVFSLMPGTAGPNRFGPDPKGIGSGAVAGDLRPTRTDTSSVWSSAADPIGYQAVAEPVQSFAPVQPTPPSVPAGWYGDPAGRHQYRYWDGMQWTSSVSNNGVASVETA